LVGGNNQKSCFLEANIFFLKEPSYHAQQELLLLFLCSKDFFFVFVDILIVFSKKISIEKKLSIFFSLVKIATEPIEIKGIKKIKLRCWSFYFQMPK